MNIRKIFISFIMLYSVFAVILRAQGIMNSYLGLYTNDDSFVFTMLTCSTCSPAGTNLLYYNPSNGDATSHMVVKINNQAYDFADTADCPVVAGSVQNGGIYITGTKQVAGQVDITTLWEFDNNPATGSPADTAKLKFTFANISGNTVNIALRLELDTMVIENDGTNISVDNGFSVITQDTAWYKSLGQVLPNWWDFDVNPTVGTPTLVGRGYTYNNITDEAATEPDIMEVANWIDVNAEAQWSVAPAGNNMATDNDSAVVLWWCNGGPASSGFALAPGNSMSFVTYYGLNQEQLLTTPTVTLTGTSSVTKTITPTFSATCTFTDTRTATQSPTITPTFTITFSSTPTFTFTSTPSVTASSTETLTYTVSPTFTHTPTITATPTVTCTKTVFCFELLGVYPNPFTFNTNIVYKVCRDADVDAVIYTVSGEIVRRLRQQASKGRNSLNWDGKNNAGTNTSSGVFIYSLEAVSEDDRVKLWGKIASIQ